MALEDSNFLTGKDMKASMKTIRKADLGSFSGKTKRDMKAGGRTASKMAMEFFIMARELSIAYGKLVRKRNSLI